VNHLVVASGDPWLDGSYGGSILDLFESLTEFGYSVNVLVPSTEGRVTKKGHLVVEGLYVRKWMPVLTLVSLWLRVIKSILRSNSTFAVATDAQMLPILVPLKVLRRTKNVMLNFSRPVGVSRARNLYFRLSLMLSRFLVDTVTAITPLEATEFAKLGIISKQRIAVIPSPVSHAFVDYTMPTDKNKIWRDLGFDSLVGKKIILYHGEIEEYRSVMEVFLAFTKAFSNREDIVLLFVGDGSARPLIEHRIQQESVRNCVALGLMPYSRIPQIIAACDVGLVILPDRPWWRYQCPTKLIELLIMGKPVVASDLPGIRWTANGSPLVTYVRRIEAEELKNAITESLTADVVMPSMGREFARRFESRNVASKIDSIIRP
jgi:glycosyltransferase involved in cell wall biosynthesis